MGEEAPSEHQRPSEAAPVEPTHDQFWWKDELLRRVQKPKLALVEQPGRFLKQKLMSEMNVDKRAWWKPSP